MTPLKAAIIGGHANVVKQLFEKNKSSPLRPESLTAVETAAAEKARASGVSG